MVTGYARADYATAAATTAAAVAGGLCRGQDSTLSDTPLLTFLFLLLFSARMHPAVPQLAHKQQICAFPSAATLKAPLKPELPADPSRT